VQQQHRDPLSAVSHLFHRHKSNPIPPHSIFSFLPQGVRTKTVKKSARTIVEKYYPRLTLDFHTNKRLIDEIAITPSKRMRNKIAGFTTHLMRRIAKGPVRNISLKLQEEERERRLDFVPEVSALEQETIAIDRETRDLLENMGFGNLNGVVVSDRVDRN
jgi:small subunit ribosomal protein S17e